MLEPTFPTLVSLFVAFVTGCYGLRTWLGKTMATLFGLDRTYCGDLGGVFGGIASLGLFLGVVAAMVWS